MTKLVINSIIRYMEIVNATTILETDTYSLGLKTFKTHGKKGLKASVSDVVAEELERFEEVTARYLRGELEEDRYRIFRLNVGIYGQRQGGHNQMARIKLPYGAITPEQLEMIAYTFNEYSRGWGHITTRQNIQIHYVQLERAHELLWDLASVGLTTREACGDTVRNITACPLAGACPSEVLDVSWWAEAAFKHFLRHPCAQRMPRKFKINFSGCAVDCGQAAFNDVGVIATTRTRPDGTVEPGFKVLIAGGLGANPHPAQALESFTTREDLMSTLEAVLRTFDHYGNRDNKRRARLKWVVDTMGIDDLRKRILRERDLLIASVTYVDGIPEDVVLNGDIPQGGDVKLGYVVGKERSGKDSSEITGMALRVVPVSLKRTSAYDRWVEANIYRGAKNSTVSAVCYARLGDVTPEQCVGLARIVRDFDVTLRTSNRQNFIIRDLEESQLEDLYYRLDEISMARPGAELARDVVSCPGADTCNLAVTQSRGLASAIGEALEEEGLGEVGGIRINISGCTNSCGQHHIADIGFMGVERRAGGRSAPGYQMFLGGSLGDSEIQFGQKALRLPAKNAAKAAVSVVKDFAEGRQVGETFKIWMDRIGGVKVVAENLKYLDVFPDPETSPEYYIDYDETGPYEVEVGQGECMGS